MGYPSSHDMDALVSINRIQNYPVTRFDVKAASRIFGFNLPSLRGKTGRMLPTPVVGNYVSIRWQLRDCNRDINPSADVLYTNNLPFLL